MNAEKISTIKEVKQLLKVSTKIPPECLTACSCHVACKEGVFRGRTCAESDHGLRRVKRSCQECESREGERKEKTFRLSSPPPYSLSFLPSPDVLQNQNDHQTLNPALARQKRLHCRLMRLPATKSNWTSSLGSSPLSKWRAAGRGGAASR